MTVTSSISQRKAISGGVSPGGRGSAILAARRCRIWSRISNVWGELTRRNGSLVLAESYLAFQGLRSFWPLMCNIITFLLQHSPVICTTALDVELGATCRFARHQQHRDYMVQCGLKRSARTISCEYSLRGYCRHTALISKPG
jgi:hypothetical protein